MHLSVPSQFALKLPHWGLLTPLNPQTKRRNQDETFLVLLICTYWEALVLAIPIFFGYKPL
jgi:hypothetical protein